MSGLPAMLLCREKETCCQTAAVEADGSTACSQPPLILKVILDLYSDFSIVLTVPSSFNSLIKCKNTAEICNFIPKKS